MPTLVQTEKGERGVMGEREREREREDRKLATPLSPGKINQDSRVSCA